jgi:opacity protein-like surface antigen
MKSVCFLLAFAATIGTSLAIAEETVMDQPMAATTLRFADSYASAFYTVDKAHYKVVLAFAAGSQDDKQLIRQTIQLEDGQTYRLSIGGYGNNEQASTISITRNNGQILADVVTCES